MNKLSIRAERKTLLMQREQEIEAIREKYRLRLDELAEAMKNAIAEEERTKQRWPTPAMLR